MGTRKKIVFDEHEEHQEEEKESVPVLDVAQEEQDQKQAIAEAPIDENYVTDTNADSTQDSTHSLDHNFAAIDDQIDSIMEDINKSRYDDGNTITEENDISGDNYEETQILDDIEDNTPLMEVFLEEVLEEE